MPAFYMIRLNKGMEAKTFTKFMVEDVFPDFPKGVTRAGQLETLQLWRGTHSSTEGSPGNQDIFLWMVDGLVAGVGERYVEKIEQYGARVEGLGNFGEVGLWRSGG